MTRFRLKISESDFEELRRLIQQSAPKESAAFALVGAANTGNDMDTLVRRVIAIPQHEYDAQDEYHLQVSPRAINGLVALCEANELGALVCHSHPADIDYSPTDDAGERRIAEVLRDFLPEGAPIASLLFKPGGVNGRVWLPGETNPVDLDEIITVGRRMLRVSLRGGPSIPCVSDIYDRHVRAFGIDGQDLIRRTKIGVVGVGGTGSPTAEQLIRLGTTDLVIIDPDEWNETNVTRVYGSYPHETRLRIPFPLRKQKKAQIVAKHLRRVNRHANVKTATLNVALDQASRLLLDRDVIFLCTDDHWGRSVVNEIAYQYLIPAINVGMAISAREGVIDHAVGVVDVLRPDLPCLWCKQAISAERIAAESMPQADRQRLAAEGYVQGLDEPAPSVISINTTLSGLAVTLFLQLVTGFMGVAGDVSRLNYNAMDSTVRRGRSSRREGCVCKRVRGFGDLRPRSAVIDEF